MLLVFEKSCLRGRIFLLFVLQRTIQSRLYGSDIVNGATLRMPVLKFRTSVLQPSRMEFASLVGRTLRRCPLTKSNRVLDERSSPRLARGQKFDVRKSRLMSYDARGRRAYTRGD